VRLGDEWVTLVKTHTNVESEKDKSDDTPTPYLFGRNRDLGTSVHIGYCYVRFLSPLHARMW
jgi:hypothetical protein